MPLYFFHVRSDGSEILDPDGVEYPDLDAARRAAVAGARSIISEEAKDGRLPLDERIDVEDGDGKILLSLSFLDAVDLPAAMSIQN